MLRASFGWVVAGPRNMRRVWLVRSLLLMVAGHLSNEFCKGLEWRHLDIQKIAQKHLKQPYKDKLFMTLQRSIFISGLLLATLTFISVVSADDTKAKSWYQETKESTAGAFIVTLDSNSPSAELNEFQEWVLTVIYKESGETASPARISVGGGMPMHGHGLPTQPQMTEYLGEGRYRLEGLKFNMHGQWILEFQIITAEASDTAVFEVVLDY